MSDNLQWIRFSNGTEKQVPKHIALDESTRKQHKFELIDKAQGKVVEVPAIPVPEKKSAAGDNGVEKENAGINETEGEVLNNDETGKVADAKLWYEKNKAGTSFAEIAKSNGLHWKSVQTAINKYKAENNIVDETPTA